MRHIRLYRAVDEVARRNSIRAAASVLAISPSALNRQILGLEEDLGAELFERLPRGVRLSTAGEIYLRSFRLHLNELDRAAAQIADLSGLRTGEVRVGVGPELSSFFAPNVIREFRSAFPGVRVEMIMIGCDEASKALNLFDVDFVVGTNPVVDSTIEIAQAGTSSIACVSQGPEVGRDTLRLSELYEHSLICHRINSGLRRTLDAAFATKRIEPNYSFLIDRSDIGLLDKSPGSTLVTSNLDIDPAAAARLGVRLRVLSSDDAPELSVQVLILRARKMPLAAEHLIKAFARRL